MNSLSWMIYGISVVSSVGSLLSFLILVSTILFGIFVVLLPMILDEIEASVIGYYVKRFLIVYAMAIFTLIVVPDKKTMVLISASEIGESLYKSEQAKGIINPSIELLQEWIKNELAEIKNKSKRNEKTGL